MGMPNIREARSLMPLPPGGPEMSRGDTSLRPPPPSRANVISNTLLAHRNAWKNLTWAGLGQKAVPSLLLGSYATTPACCGASTNPSATPHI